MSLKSKAVKYGTIAVIGGFILYLIKEGARSVSGGAAQSVDSVSESVGSFLGMFNPFSQENIFYKGFTKGYMDVTGSKQSLGADIYDLTHKQNGGAAAGAGSVVIPYNDQYASVEPDYTDAYMKHLDKYGQLGPYPDMTDWYNVVDPYEHHRADELH